MGLSYFFCPSCHESVCECYESYCLRCFENEFQICDDCTSNLPNICNKHICYHCLFNFFDENKYNDEKLKTKEKLLCEKYNITEKELKESITKAKEYFLNKLDNAERDYIIAMERYNIGLYFLSVFGGIWNISFSFCQ